jgi:hypothetical protein
MTLTTITPGVDTGFSTKLNTNFTAVDYRLLAINTTSSSLASYAGATGNLAIIAIPAGVTDFVNAEIDIFANVDVSGSPPNGSSDVYLIISVGVAGSETFKTIKTVLHQNANMSGMVGGGGISTTATINYYYAPSAAEKSAGFNIKLLGTATGYNTYACTITQLGTRVFGR